MPRPVTDAPRRLPALGRLALGHSREARTYRRVRRALIADAGGEDCSATLLATADVLAMAVAMARTEFARYATSADHDPARFAALGNLALGCTRTLGTERRTRDATVDAIERAWATDPFTEGDDDDDDSNL